MTDRNDKKIDIAKQSWSVAPDQHVFKALENISDYDVEVREIILREANRRNINTEDNIQKNKRRGYLSAPLQKALIASAIR